MSDRSADRRSPEDAEHPKASRVRVGSGAPVSEDPAGDVEYRGTEDRDAGSIFVETLDGKHEYGR